MIQSNISQCSFGLLRPLRNLQIVISQGVNINALESAMNLNSNVDTPFHSGEWFIFCLYMYANGSKNGSCRRFGARNCFFPSYHAGLGLLQLSQLLQYFTQAAQKSTCDFPLPHKT